MNIVIQPCNDCKKIRVFKINKDQDAFYYKGIRLRECEQCGRYEELIKKNEVSKGRRGQGYAYGEFEDESL